MESADARCLKLAARQLGVLTRAQAREHGLSNRAVTRRVELGLWESLYPSVFRVEGSTPTWRQRLMAALLWAGRGAALSHRAAAGLHGFARFGEGPIELSATFKLHSVPRAEVHLVGELSWQELCWSGPLTLTKPTRTLLDLSATEDAATLRASVDEALRRRWMTLERLQVAVSGAAKRHGVPALRAIVNELAGGDAPLESELEARVAEVLASAGFPRPIKQKVIRIGTTVCRVDFLIPGTKVVIEADGYAYHSGFQSFERQRERQRMLIARGFVVLPWTWNSLKRHREQLVRQLRETLAEHASEQVS